MSNQVPTAGARPIHKLHSQYNSKQYDRIRVLGKGSFGTAVVHRRRADCSLVVLKEIDLQRFKGDQEKELAINEARIMSTLNHTHIINYHNAYTTDTKLIIEMEYARQGTLATYLSFQVQPLEEQEILVIFRQICAGLNYLHLRNIIHLDLKMANLFVTTEGQVKIGDFGIAQYMRSQSDSSTHVEDDRMNECVSNQQGGRQKKVPPPSGSHLLGTLAYSSPERCLGEQTDFKSDIWSLGCILYELITNQALFQGESLPELVLNITRIQYQPINRNVSLSLSELFEQMIVRDPNDRPSAKQLLTATGQMLSRIQLNWQRLHSAQTSRQRAGGGQRRYDLSTEVALLAAHNQAKDMSQINYLHSLVYQVRLDGRHVRLDRVNLPQMKRIKEICKGKSHYLVLTYDSIVYGWGDKSQGQLGACSLATGSPAGSRGRAFSNSRGADFLSPKTTQLPTSSTQTIVPNDQQSHGKQSIFSMLEELPPSTKPFIINELNHRKIIQVAAGDNFSVFLNKTGIVMTCGDGSTGCLGRGSLQSCFTPCMVESLLNSDVVSISSGPEHVVAVCGNGRAFAWGNSRHGRLGIGSPAKEKYVLRPRPIQFRSATEVYVKSVFCGDRCTVFIDSDGKCWACGENRSNKLGLDIRRRFKKTVIVEQSWQPAVVGSLAKYKIVGCSIGKNHSSFMTNEGKLIVFGQDIDHTYRLQSNIMRARESHRRISFELKGRTQKSCLPSDNRDTPVWSASECKQLAKSSIHNNQLAGFKTKLMYENSENEHLVSSSSESIRKYPKYKLTRAQLQQIESYVRKSRAHRKMPFECVISVSCSSRFSLALTSDNRVYFWGTRSHRKEADSSHLSFCGACSRRLANSATEPQLISNQSSIDECFIKTGTTNDSLMSSIQALGSDQPIIHAQDPRLTARTPADLWILDYRPSEAATNDNDQSISSSRSSINLTSSNLNNLDEITNDTGSECCSECCHNALRQDDDFCLRHDAILEPQPVVSLYVPAMYNHNGCSLHLADLFCFDEDRFYLVLDTTIKMHQSNAHSSRPSSRYSNAHGDQKQQSATQVAGETSDKTVNKEQQRVDYDKSDRLILKVSDAYDILEAAREDNTLESEKAGNKSDVGQDLSKHEQDEEDDINNNNILQRTSTSQGGVSLEEPRSLSTFGGPSLGCNAQIIMGPSMRTMEREETLRPLSFDGEDLDRPSVSVQSTGSSEQVECPVVLDIQQPDDDPTVGNGAVKGLKGRCPLLSVMRRSINMGELAGSTKRQRLHRSESTTNCLSIDIDETSSMPSWVRNEFIQHQNQQQQVSRANDEESLTPSDTEEGGSATPSLSNRSANNEAAYDCWDRETSKNSLHSSNGTEVTINNQNPEPRKTSLMLSSKPQFISRSQPDISEFDIRIESPCEVIERRASVLDEDTKSPIRASNLLDCDIYKRDVNQQISQYQSSLLTSYPSTRANSHSPLIKPDASPQISRSARIGKISDEIKSTSCEDLQAIYIKPGQMKERAASVSKMERSSTAPYAVQLSPASQNLEISSEKPHQIMTQSGKAHEKSSHHLRMNARGFKIYRSMAQLEPKRPMKGGKSASSTSLASQLRKSFIKLFC